MAAVSGSTTDSTEGFCVGNGGCWTLLLLGARTSFASFVVGGITLRLPLTTRPTVDVPRPLVPVAFIFFRSAASGFIGAIDVVSTGGLLAVLELVTWLNSLLLLRGCAEDASEAATDECPDRVRL